MSAYPPSRVARVGTWLVNIAGHDAASADDNILADTNRQDRAIGSKAHARAYPGGLPSSSIATRWATAQPVIDEHHPMADEAILANGDQLADEAVGLDAGPGTDHGLALDLAERADQDIIAKCGPVDVAWGVDDDPLTRGDIPNPALTDLEGHVVRPSLECWALNRIGISVPVSMDS